MADTRGEHPTKYPERITRIFNNLTASWVKWNNYYLGRTLEGPIISVETNTIDINYQQGNKGKMRTEEVYTVTMDLVDLSSDLFALIIPGWKKSTTDDTALDMEGMSLGVSDLYKEERSLAKPMEIIACKNDGVTEDPYPQNKIVLYKTYPEISGDLLSFSKDSVSSLKLTFNVYVHLFSESFVTATPGVKKEVWDPLYQRWNKVTEKVGSAIGYIGDPSKSGCEPVQYR